jgi:periplasmic protein TonB
MRRLTPTAGYALSAAAHLGIFAWAWSLPARANRPDKVDVEIVETVKPRPVEPKAPPPEPPKPAEPIKMRPARRIALKTPPPPSAAPPPETPPPETPPPTSAPAAPGPVHLGISLSSTSTGGGFAAPVGNSLGGRPSGRQAAAPAGDDIGPIVHGAALTVQPEPVDVGIPASEYPKEALDAGFESSVVLKIVIDSNGRVRRAVVVKDPGYGLGAAAMKSALRHFRFKPGEVNGKVTAVEWTFTVTYELP